MSDAVTRLLAIAAAVALVLAIAGTAFVLGGILPAPRPVHGHRGEKRARALAQSSLLRLGEPLVLQVAAWIARVLPPGRRAALGERLVRGGHFHGLTPEELVATSLLAALLGSFMGGAAVAIGAVSASSAAAFVVLFGALPFLRLGSEEKSRGKEMSRRLPAAIDLVALCMSAGIDFPGALRFVVGEREGRDLAREELALVVQALELGHTRAEALSQLGRRVPCDAVDGFVAVVVQAEEKGNPLSELLQIQAKVLRGHRSLAAEEAAARAGVLMVGPLLLLLACVLVVLIGPFVVSGGL